MSPNALASSAWSPTDARSAGMAFQLGASHPCGGTQLERIRDAVTLGPAAVQVILPDWLPLVDWYRRIREHAPATAVFGPGHDLATGMTHGAAGSYSNIACLSPTGAVAWWRQMASDPAGALDVERRIHAFQAERIMPLQNAGFSNPALDKALAAAGGWANCSPERDGPGDGHRLSIR